MSVSARYGTRRGNFDNSMNNDERKYNGATIFLVDDEPTVLRCVAEMVSSLGCTTVSFSSAAECLKAVGSERCDLLISDVSMPEMDGITLLKEVKARKPRLPVLLITGYGGIPIAVKAVKEGAMDFLEKPLDEQTLIAAVEEGLQTGSAKLTYNDEPITEAEAKVLELVAAGKSNKEIAFMLNRSIRTVENHRHRLMKKLKVDSTAALVKVAISLGLTFPESK